MSPYKMAQKNSHLQGLELDRYVQTSATYSYIGAILVALQTASESANNLRSLAGIDGRLPRQIIWLWTE